MLLYWNFNEQLLENADTCMHKSNRSQHCQLKTKLLYQFNIYVLQDLQQQQYPALSAVPQVFSFLMACTKALHEFETDFSLVSQQQLIHSFYFPIFKGGWATDERVSQSNTATLCSIVWLRTTKTTASYFCACMHQAILIPREIETMTKRKIPQFSHLPLENPQQKHQTYRNYPPLLQ